MVCSTSELFPTRLAQGTSSPSGTRSSSSASGRINEDRQLMQRSSWAHCRYSRQSWRLRCPILPRRTCVVPSKRAQEGPSIIFTRSVANNAAKIRPTEETHSIEDSQRSSLLERARLYGIVTLTQLESQRPPNKNLRIGELLVDHEPHRSDFQLWILLLQYSVMRHGLNGAKRIWEALKYRGSRVVLSQYDDSANAFLCQLLSVIIKANDEAFLKRLCEPQGLVWQRPNLVSDVIAATLREGNQQLTSSMIRYFYNRGRALDELDSTDLHNLFDPQRPDAVAAFCRLYGELKLSRQFDPVIQFLVEHEKLDEALSLTKFFVSRGDLPKSFESVRFLMVHLAKHKKDPAPFLRLFRTGGISYPTAMQLVYDAEQAHPGSGLMMQLSGSVSDVFAAKAFATKTFSFDLVLNSFKAFGLTQIGPQTLREIGLVAGNSASLKTCISKIDALGIDTGASTYSRIVRVLCNSGNDHILNQVLTTDMHHEVFDDLPLQRRLLQEKLKNGEWDQVNLLLVVINDGNSSVLDVRARDELLEACLASPRSLLGLSVACGASHSFFDARIVSSIATKFINRLRNLRHRPRRRSVEANVDQQRRLIASMLAGLLQRAVDDNIPTYETHWRSIIVELGKVGAFEEINAICRWLAMILKRQQAVSSPALVCRGPTLEKSTADHVFGDKCQSTLLHWSLRRSIWARDAGEFRRWQDTLLLFKELYTNYNVTMRFITMRRAIILRGRELLPPTSTSTPKDTVLARSFCLDVVMYMQHLFNLTRRQAMHLKTGILYPLTKRGRKLKKLSPKSGRRHGLAGRVATRDQRMLARWVALRDPVRNLSQQALIEHTVRRDSGPRQQ